MFIIRLLIWIVALIATFAVAQPPLNVTAIGAQNGVSTLECWEVDSPSGAGRTNRGNVSTLSWSIGPPGHYDGPHNTPYNQWVVLLKGLVYIALPNNNGTEAYITSGGIIFAADTPDVSREGHISKFLGTTESIYLSIATPDGKSPNHKRLHMGPCGAEDTAGWRM